MNLPTFDKTFFWLGVNKNLSQFKIPRSHIVLSVFGDKKRNTVLGQKSEK